jgi:acyl-CoA synthetase (NDP forming)
MSLQSLFYPRGVAVIGSTSEGKIGYELIRQLVDGGYREVFAVNPKAQGALSVPGYEAISKIGRPVDLAVIASPTPTVPNVLADCGRAGIKAAVIITAGFSEVGNQAGEDEISQVANRYGIRFIGPNCAGMVNTRHRLFPTLETRPPAGAVSIVAQSGAVGGVVLAWAQEHGLGIAKFASYGNGADLNEIDLLRYLAEDPETEAVGLYIETVTDGRAFMQAVRYCTRHKPVIVIKAGRTRSGHRAALSHTGSMAGADAVYDAALRQCGAIRVHTIEGLFDLCKAFLHVPHLSGRRVAIVTNSGGPGVLAADRAEEVGLEVAEPSPGLKKRLSEFLPAHCALRNPIDLTVEGTEEGYRRTLLAVLDEYDAALALNVATPYIDSVPLARGTCDAAAQSGKPVVASFLPGQIVAQGVAYLQERGVPNFATGERAVTALARMATYHESANSQIHEPPRVGESQVGTVDLPAAIGHLPGEGPMLEPEAMAWLRDNALPVPDFYFASTQAQAIRGCDHIGYPVVMKVVSPDILHKSDYGGILLDIRDEPEAAAAFQEIRQAATSRGKRFHGVIIYPMIHDAQEVLLGLSHDPQFGPVVAFGLGGIYTEVWHDVSLRVAPIDHTEAAAMIREIASFPLLQGVRGHEGRDLGALATVLARFSQLPFQYPDVAEVDLNPVFLLSEGLVVGDVRVIRKT